MDTCVCLAEPLRYTPETTTMLLMAIPQYKIKRGFFFLKVDPYFLKKHKKKELVRKDKSLKKNEVEEEDTAGGYN